MKAYSFNNVVMLVNGIEMTGWPEGNDVIMCDRNEDSATQSVGVGGEMTVSVSQDRTGVVKFKLKQNSPSNGVMTAIITSQENGLFVPVFVQVKNTQGGELVSGTQGFVKRPAGIKFGDVIDFSEWEIVCERLDFINTGTEAQ